MLVFLYADTVPEPGFLAALTPALVQNLPDEIGTALVIGHNPDLQELAALLTGYEVAMKTSWTAVLTWPGAGPTRPLDAVLLRHHSTPRG